MLKYDILRYKAVIYDFNYINAYFSFYRFKLMSTGDLIAASPYADFSGLFMGLCIAKSHKKIITNSTLKLRNVFHLNIVEKIYTIGCSFHGFNIIRPYYKMFIKNFRKKLFYYRKMLRSLSVFKPSKMELRTHDYFNDSTY